MFFGVIGFLLLGFPVAFTLAGVALLFGLIGWAFGAFDPTNLTSLTPRYLGIMLNDTLVAVPLFIFMGMMLERSGIAEQLLVTMGRLFGTLRGGLGLSVVVVGAFLAASTGVVGATVVTMGLLSLPAMLRAGYDPKLATGVICASGTLGQIIPPSTVLIFMGDMLGGMNAQVQMEKGNFAPEVVSVGNLFAGAFLPGPDARGFYMALGGLAGLERSAEQSRAGGDGRGEGETGARRDGFPDPDSGADRGGAGLDPGGDRHAHGVGLRRRGGGDAARAGAGAVLLDEPQGRHGGDGDDDLADFRDPARRLAVRAGIPDAGGRPAGRGLHDRAAGRALRGDPVRDAADVPTGVHPRHL
jgi:hypothetical protein